LNTATISRQLDRAFRWSFYISVGSFIALVIEGLVTASHHGITIIEAILVLLMIAAAPVWYVTLGMVAYRLGRRWPVWTGLSFITSPIGPFVIYPLMRSHMKAATAGATPAEAAAT
jgi:hypothetical protein